MMIPEPLIPSLPSCLWGDLTPSWEAGGGSEPPKIYTFVCPFLREEVPRRDAQKLPRNQPREGSEEIFDVT